MFCFLLWFFFLIILILYFFKLCLFFFWEIVIFLDEECVLFFGVFFGVGKDFVLVYVRCGVKVCLVVRRVKVFEEVKK